MKLLFCPKCSDVFSLSFDEKSCSCGESKGKYLDNLSAEHTGGIPIGFDNTSFVIALKQQPDSGMGKKFNAFVIPKQCNTFKKIERMQKSG